MCCNSSTIGRARDQIGPIETMVFELTELFEVLIGPFGYFGCLGFRGGGSVLIVVGLS